MKATAQMGGLTRDGWNEAIEAAAKVCEECRVLILGEYDAKRVAVAIARETGKDLARQILALKREPNAAVSIGPTCPSFVCLTPKGCALYGCKMQPPPPERP